MGYTNSEKGFMQLVGGVCILIGLVAMVASGSGWALVAGMSWGFAAATMMLAEYEGGE